MTTGLVLVEIQRKQPSEKKSRITSLDHLGTVEPLLFMISLRSDVVSRLFSASISFFSNYCSQSLSPDLEP